MTEAAANAAAFAAKLSDTDRLVCVLRWIKSSSAVGNRLPQYSRPCIQLQICGPAAAAVGGWPPATELVGVVGAGELVGGGCRWPLPYSLEYELLADDCNRSK